MSRKGGRADEKGRRAESRLYVEGHSVGSKIFILESYQIEDKYWLKEEQGEPGIRVVMGMNALESRYVLAGY
jgi:hypothetical protein